MMDLEAIKTTMNTWSSAEGQPPRGSIAPAGKVVELADLGLALIAEVERLRGVTAQARNLPRCSRCYYGDSHRPTGGKHDAGSFEALLEGEQ